MDDSIHPIDCWIESVDPSAIFRNRSAAMQKVNPAEVARSLTEFWSQEVIGRANGNLIKVAKGMHSTDWHAHEDQEETFLVLEGRLTIQLRDGNVDLEQGDFVIVPRGVEHCPATDKGASFLMIGPEVTSNAAGGKPAWSYGAGTRSATAGAGDREISQQCGFPLSDATAPPRDALGGGSEP